MKRFRQAEWKLGSSLIAKDYQNDHEWSTGAVTFRPRSNLASCPPSVTSALSKIIFLSHAAAKSRPRTRPGCSRMLHLDYRCKTTKISLADGDHLEYSRKEMLRTQERDKTPRKALYALLSAAESSELTTRQVRVIRQKTCGLQLDRVLSFDTPEHGGIT